MLLLLLLASEDLEMVYRWMACVAGRPQKTVEPPVHASPDSRLKKGGRERGREARKQGREGGREPGRERAGS